MIIYLLDGGGPGVLEKLWFFRQKYRKFELDTLIRTKQAQEANKTSMKNEECK